MPVVKYKDMKADMHLHTKYSPDSFTSPEAMARTAAKRGMDCIAITDHNTIKSWREMQRVTKRLGLCLIKGEEIKVFVNGKKVGEILGYFLTEEVKPGNPLDVIDEIRSQGGVSSLAHPFDRGGSLFSFPEVVKKVDALEVFNARVIRSAKNDMAMSLAKDKGKGLTAGSDAHSTIEVGRAYLTSHATNAEELRKAILRGKVGVEGKRSCPLVHIVSVAAKIRNFTCING